MKAVFFGTPEFAVPSLEAALSGTDVALVVTQPDRPVGRHADPVASPVAARAERAGIAGREARAPAGKRGVPGAARGDRPGRRRGRRLRPDPPDGDPFRAPPRVRQRARLAASASPRRLARGGGVARGRRGDGRLDDAGDRGARRGPRLPPAPRRRSARRRTPAPCRAGSPGWERTCSPRPSAGSRPARSRRGLRRARRPFAGRFRARTARWTGPARPRRSFAGCGRFRRGPASTRSSARNGSRFSTRRRARARRTSLRERSGRGRKARWIAAGGATALVLRRVQRAGKKAVSGAEFLRGLPELPARLGKSAAGG